MDSPPKAPTARKLLAWYDRSRRTLAWRAEPGVEAEPYRVWLSEIMLQQTTVAAVTPYYEAFLKKWPTLESLAAASRDDVLTAWAGLGYYSRARNLHACAQTLVQEYSGQFPQTAKQLEALPGIGAYTSAAIAAIAFGEPVAVVDGNVERVITRQFSLATPLPQVKRAVKERVAVLVPKGRPGDFAQAMMDLGATVCTPKSPRCGDCPWAKSCSGFLSGDPLKFPVRAPKKEKPVRRGLAFRLTGPGARILIEQRPEKGLLAAMWQVPTGPWLEVSPSKAFGSGELARHAPIEAVWTGVPGLVKHTFTHFHLELAVYEATAPKGANPNRGQFARHQDLGSYAIPSVMQKVLRHGR